MDINEIFERVKYLADKSGLDSYISPNDFNQMFNGASMRHYNSQYKIYAATQRISDSLSVHLSEPIDIVLNSDGQYILPENVMHVASVMKRYNGTFKKVDRVELDRLAPYLSNSYDAPDEEFSIYVKYKKYIMVYPVDSKGIVVTNLLRPIPAKWAYTLDSRGRPVYSSAASIQTAWSDTDIDSIIYEMLKDYAMNAKDGELENYTQLQSKQQA